MMSFGAGLWQIYGAGAAACAALTAGLWLGLVSPSLEQLDRQASQKHELAERRQKLDTVNASLESAKHEAAALQASIAKRPLKLEPASAVNQRLAALTSLAMGNGLALDEIRPGAVADAAHFQTLPIHLAGKGSYPAGAAFLHKLRETFPDTGVKSLEATNSDPAESSKASFQIDLIWYTKK